MKIIIIALALLSTSAFAAKPYGTAGCGLGSVMIGKDNGQISAATTNGTGTQTFGISSGSSNCITATEQTARIRNFIEGNYESLVTDMAKGRGDSVTTLASFYGCETGVFATEMKNNYESITPASNNAVNLMVNINSMMETSPALDSACTRAI